MTDEPLNQTQTQTAAIPAPFPPPLSESHRATLEPDDDDEAEASFPVDCLPPVLANMTQAINAAVQTPEALGGCCILGAISATIGKGLRVRSSTAGRITPGNLYILASAESGTGKSEAFRHAVRPLLEFEKSLVDAWETGTLPKAKAESEALRVEGQKITGELAKAATPFEKARLQDELAKVKAREMEVAKLLTPPNLISEDCTQEKLAMLLQKNQECIASMSADAGSIVNNLLGRNLKKADQTDDNIYLRGYSLESTRIDRVSREPVRLEEPCVSAHWLVQPDKVDRLLANPTLTEGGLIPRMLLCHTHAKPQKITGPLPKIPVYHADNYQELLTDLLNTYRMADSPFIIEPTEEAQDLMDGYYNEIVDRREADLHDAGSYAARWGENAWRIAVCLHAGKHGKAAKDHPLDEDTAAKAIKLMRYFAGEQLKILAAGRTKHKESEFQKIESFARKLPLSFTARELQREVFRTKKSEDIKPLLDEMVSLGKLGTALSTKETGGRPKHIYFLPPPPLK